MRGLYIKPLDEIRGEINSPPSKSYTHRYLYLSLLCPGIKIINTPLKSRDTFYSFKAVRSFGVRGTIYKLFSDGKLVSPLHPIYCGNSGTTARFSVSIAGLAPGSTIIDGSDKLRKRPMKPLLDALVSIGIKVNSNRGFLPVKIKGNLSRWIEVEIDGSISSQFVSSLILLASLYGGNIHIKGNLSSRGYVDLTLMCLDNAGIKYYRDGYRLITIYGREDKHNLYNFNVPGDYSSISYFIILALLRGKLKIRGISKNDCQPDARILKIVSEAGGKFHWLNDHDLIIEQSDMDGFQVDIINNPDLFPPLCILASFSKGTSIIKGIRNLKYKESNRIKSITYNLNKMGVKYWLKKDFIKIRGGVNINKCKFRSFADHRVAMAFIIASSLLSRGGVVYGYQSIPDSYPGFLVDFKSIGGVFKIE